jgi:predicted Fe-S protein YdhL (DUF1289 family)
MRPLAASPCTQVCQIDAASGWCRGCARSLDEIAAWSRADDDARWLVLKQLPPRREALQASGRWIAVDSGQGVRA